VLEILAAALVPICFAVGLGWFAGWLKMLDGDKVRSISLFVVSFALPALLFVGTFKFTIEELSQWQNLVVLLVAMVATWVMAFLFGRTVLGVSTPEAAILGLTSSFPNMAYVGVAVLTSLFTATGLLPVILGNFVSSFVLIPLTVIVLHLKGTGAAQAAGQPAAKSTLGKDLIHTIVQPLVWAPLLAIVLVLAHVGLPSLAAASVNQIGATAGGVALFALGVMLFSFSFHINREVGTVFVIKNLIQPGVAAALVFAFGMHGPLAEGLVIVLACPAATACPMLASTYRVGEKSAAAAVTVSTVCSLLTISGWILLSQAAFG
jgi:malonate transporter